MDIKDALVLDNWIVTPGRIKIRPGRTTWTTGLAGSFVETLMEYAPASGAPRLFAALPAAVYDVTVPGVAGSPVLTGLSNGRWSHLNFATAGGNYLIATNGADGVRSYNGTTWTTQSITGVDPANLVTVTSHMNRLWFIEKNTRRVWYLGSQAIAGAATAFDLAQLTPLGGQLLAMDTWTRDGGDGPDDAAVFVTTKGEVLIYSGTDPAQAATWALVGRYKIPPPIGRRCTLKLGAELIVLTEQGPLPLSQASGLALAAQVNASLTDKISGAFVSAAQLRSGSFGWQIMEHTGYSLVIVNLPIGERASQEQFVFSTLTGAWSRLSGFNAGCWGRLGGELYFGGNDGTVQRVTGQNDDGAPILATYQHAFTNLKNPADKVFKMARPKLVAPAGFVPVVAVKTRYDTSLPEFRVIAALDPAPPWDDTPWDVAFWAAESVPSQAWQSVEGEGDTVSLALRISATAALELNGVDLVYEAGGLL